MNERTYSAASRLGVAFITMTAIMHSVSVATIPSGQKWTLHGLLVGGNDTTLVERLFLWRDYENMLLLSNWFNLAAALVIALALALHYMGKRFHKLWTLPLAALIGLSVVSSPSSLLVQAISPVFLEDSYNAVAVGYGQESLAIKSLSSLEEATTSVIASNDPFVVLTRIISVPLDLLMIAAGGFAALASVWMALRAMLPSAPGSGNGGTTQKLRQPERGTISAPSPEEQGAANSIQ